MGWALMASYACCVQGCGGHVCFSTELEKRLRQTHEYWMCPFGHQQHFATKTDQERLLQAAEDVRDRWRARAEGWEHEFGTCPMCDWRSRSSLEHRWLSMLRHFAKTHGATVEDFGPGTHPVYAMKQAQEEAS